MRTSTLENRLLKRMFRMRFKGLYRVNFRPCSKTCYFTGMIYIRRADLKPLQTYLRSVIIVEPSPEDAANVESLEQNLTPDATNGAKIFLGLLPILCLYPFLQKYFAKGIVRGSVKE